MPPEICNFTFKIMNSIESQKGEIVMYQPDETIRLEVRMGEDTVWLSQQQMADLFNKDRTVIGRHIRNIYKEEELEEGITCAKFAHMGKEGDQPYEYTAYNLNVIISVGSSEHDKIKTPFVADSPIMQVKRQKTLKPLVGSN